MRQKIPIALELMKIRITGLAAITTLFGFICASGTISVGAVLPVLGIFLVACGSAVINHYQEVKTDSLMDRTKDRPIPAGKIHPESALLFSVFLVIFGTTVLLSGAGLLAAALSLLALAWYNLLYTPLKKRSPFAVIPGAVIGAIPPVIGWVSAGGSVFDAQILLISAVFFIWQIPHFWLLLLIYDSDYEKGGLPVLTRLIPKPVLSRITFLWVVLTAFSGLLLPLYGIVVGSIVSYSILCAAVCVVLAAVKLLFSGNSARTYRFAFHSINAFVIFIMISVSLGRIINGSASTPFR